ncbi:hypothetical protein LAZ67_3005737 [Cordylochernes scorpioides]|uniref:ATP-dependent DNA helicase n=1 Tax=Cordylochernes scorpioides TaxID=51811 RepID=A0ABY6KAI5_9ARAC|nr:hypothetical protein LAZ67_3005737 [Cordylochernes scorpioides]
MLTVAYGEATLDRSNVYRWYKMFSEGREDVNDEERAGRPSTSTADEKINDVEKMILANRRITVREVAEDLNISIGSCHSIFINDLGMRRVAAKLVPKLLNCDQKQHRMNIANEMLDSVRDDPNLLQRVITGDEAWVYGYDVETKAQSSQWKLPHEPRPKKARQVRSNVKVLLTVFFECKGVVHHEFVPQGRTVNKEYYLQAIRNLREAISQKRPDLWKNLPMKGRRYVTLDEIKTASKVELKKIFKNDFLKCFEDWKNRCHKCIISHGDYIEGDKIDFRVDRTSPRLLPCRGIASEQTSAQVTDGKMSLLECAVQTGSPLPLIDLPPEPLRSLLSGENSDSVYFLRNIRKYNSCFQMTSFGAENQTHSVTFPTTFSIQGQVYHRIGSLMPSENQPSRFLQIYFMGNDDDDDDDIQTDRRCQQIQGVRRNIVQGLQRMLHQHNLLVQQFKTALENLPSDAYRVVVNADRTPPGQHPRRYNAPTANEVAVVLAGNQFGSRDIVLHQRDNLLQHVSDTHRFYDALQYSLIFWKGQEGYSFHIPQIDLNSRQPLSSKVSSMNFYGYFIMVRRNSPNVIVQFGQLFHQFLVDMYAKVESERLRYITLHQRNLRAESYIHLRDALSTDANINPNSLGQRIILPSSFVNSPRYLAEYTQDAFCYVRKFGRPDLFITFTSNPSWEELSAALLPGQKQLDRHDITARVFRQKLVKFIEALTKGQLYGATVAWMYSVEWQKRGLPHAHILVWLANKLRPTQIDSVICAEFPDPIQDPLLYNIVVKNMIHGPCGEYNPVSPCMKNSSCSKKYPKQFLLETQTNENGYPLYRRRAPEAGGFTSKVKIRGREEVTIDNRWVVPYSPLLSKMTLLYPDVPQYYTWNSSAHEWRRRVQGKLVEGRPGVKRSDTIGRVYAVHVSNFECFCLRMLLHNIKGPTSFAYLKIVNGSQYETFRETCAALGLLENDNHWVVTMDEAVLCQAPTRVRQLFAILISTCTISNPQQLWITYRDEMASDILHRYQLLDSSIRYNDLIYNETLCNIEDRVVSICGKKLQELGLGAPRRNVVTNSDILRELAYDTAELEDNVASMLPKLLPEQIRVFDAVLAKIYLSQPIIIFLDSPGGTGKTFILNLLLAMIRKEQNIAIAVASSGIAATLLAGGRTAHSVLKLPLTFAEGQTAVCNIRKNSDKASLLRSCKLLVWDECTMAHKIALEALDRTLQDIRDDPQPMGGLVVLLAGDFRQTLPVVTRGTPADELNACLKSSYLWSHIVKMHLTVNMRVQLHNDTTASQFADELLKIGEGQLETDSEGNIQFSNTFLPSGGSSESLYEKVFPNIGVNYLSEEWLCARTILAPKNSTVLEINNTIVNSIPGESKIYRSIDTMVDPDESVS